MTPRPTSLPPSGGTDLVLEGAEVGLHGIGRERKGVEVALAEGAAELAHALRLLSR